MKKTILFVDNTEDFLDVHAKLLEYRGYDVIRATTVAEAEGKLKQFNVQLAVLDIRLEDEDDPLDISGLALAKNKYYHYLPKIILTAYPSWEYAEIALGAGLRGLGVVKMALKDDGTDEILDAVDRAFAEHVPVNWSLIVRGSESSLLTLPHLVSSISPAVAGKQLTLRAAEVQELLSRLFLEHDEVFVDRMVAQASGRVWLVVSAFSKHGDEQQYLVALGKRPLITQDLSKFNQFIPQNNNHFPVIQWQGETVHYAGYALVLPGISDLDDVATLLHFYHHHPLEQLTEVLKQLFEGILTPWYQASRAWEDAKGLSQLHELWLKSIDKEQTEADLASIIRSICDQAQTLGLARLDYSPQRLTLHLPQTEPIVLPNPVTALSQTQLDTTEPILYGTSHGKLDGTAVLTDTQNNCWIIDYAHVNRGPLLQDFVCLEAAIKYDMLIMLDFSQRYKMEKYLLAASRLDDDIAIEDVATENVATENVVPEIAKAVKAIAFVRKQAAKIGIKMTHYHLGQMLHTLGRLLTYQPGVRHTRRELMPYLHTLVSAAMIQQKLIAPSRPDLPTQAIYGLWIDEEKQEVWVEGQIKEDLTTQEYELLYFLYKRAEESCSRELILKEVFEIEYSPDMLPQQRKSYSDPRINSAISRLRKKIEPDPDNPKYIISVWGSGYKLNLEA
jgi:DNA-binding response OmpR family regulator